MVTQTWSGAQLLFSRHLAAGDVEETAEKQQRRIEASISDRSFGRRCSARELRWAAALVSLRFESMMMISCRRVEAAHSGANKPETNHVPPPPMEARQRQRGAEKAPIWRQNKSGESIGRQRQQLKVAALRSSHSFNRACCPSVRPSACPSACPSVCLAVGCWRLRARGC